MSRLHGSIWERPASFWVGAGFVAEFPFWMVEALAPDGTCEAAFGRLTGCPVPIWLVVTLALLSYAATAYFAHRLAFDA